MLIYTYPMCGVAVSNTTSTERVKVPIGNCANNLGFDEPCDCMSSYCQLYKDTDTFTIQLSLQNGLQTLIRIDIYDLDNNLVASKPYGLLTNTKSIWNEYGVQSTTLIDMGGLHDIAGVDCFYLDFIYDNEHYVSAPYCLVKCEDKSFLISSTYTSIDCNNKVWNYQTLYDEDANSIVPMSNEIRLKGSLNFIARSGENVYEEADTSITTRRIHTKSTQIYEYELRGWSIPEWQVKLLSAILGGSDLKITDEKGSALYETNGGFSKNAMGSDWFPLIKLQQVCSIFTKNC